VHPLAQLNTAWNAQTTPRRPHTSLEATALRSFRCSPASPLPTREVSGCIGGQHGEAGDGVQLVVLGRVGGPLEHVQHALQTGWWMLQGTWACNAHLPTERVQRGLQTLQALEPLPSDQHHLATRTHPHPHDVHTCVMVKPPPMLTADTSSAAHARPCKRMVSASRRRN